MKQIFKLLMNKKVIALLLLTLILSNNTLTDTEQYRDADYGIELCGDIDDSENKK